MGRTTLDILSVLGTRQQQMGDFRVLGPAKAVRGITYVPKGGILNGIGSLQFRIPLRYRYNQAIQEGVIIRVTDSDLGEMGTYIVDEHSEEQDGLDATFSCPDLMQELIWQTLPGFQSATMETSETTVARLAASHLETPWNGIFKGAAVDYTGVGFAADKISIFQAYQQLYAQRGFNFRRGMGKRDIEVGDLGEDAGIRLSSPSPVPAYMRRTNVRPILDGGFNPKYDSGALVNMIIPTGGGGTGFAALDLSALYNPAGEIAYTIGAYGTQWYSSGPSAFAGYDPNFPIWRRGKYNGTGWEYFLWDYTNEAKYRIRMLPFSVSHVAPVSGALLDMKAAAAAMYTTALTELKARSSVNLAYDITTAGNGDIRMMAGKYVQVYAPKAKVYNDRRRVVSVTRQIDDTTGAATDRWLVSSSGRDTTSASGIQTGMLQTINYMRTVPAMYPARIIIPGFANIDNNLPHTFTIPGDTSVAGRVAVLLTINCVPAVSPVSTAASVGHSHTVAIPVLSVNVISGGNHEHGGTTNAPSSVSGSTAGSTISGTASNANIGGTPTHQHDNVFIQTGQGTPVDASHWLGVVGSGDTTLYAAGASGRFRTGTAVLSQDLNPSSHGHGVGGSAGGQTISSGTAATQGINTYAGFSISGVTTATNVTSAPGGEHTHALAWGVMKGPLPTYVSVRVDGNYVLYQINSPSDTRKAATVDLLAYTNDQKDHVVEISSLTVGGVAYFLNERHRETTYNAA